MAKDNYAQPASALSNPDPASTAAQENVALGVNAMGTNSSIPGYQNSGNHNVAIGFAALEACELASDNVALGWEAMQGHKGSRNVAIGRSAMAIPNGQGTDNVALGMGALQSNANGTDNVAAGLNAMLNADGSENVAVGKEALQGGTNNASYVARNVAIGRGAMSDNPVLFQDPEAYRDSVAVGWEALKSAGPLQITAVGSQALRVNQGVQNTAIGYSTLTKNTLGSGNTAVGHMALTNSRGDHNTAVGAGAIRATGNDGSNTGIGFEALASTTGRQNTACGCGALSNLVDGHDNIAVGTLAGFTLTGKESGNIYIGNPGTTGENFTIRIGPNQQPANPQVRGAFISGIWGNMSPGRALAVLIDGEGQLVSPPSSIRFKEDVRDIAEASARVYDLRPVSFRYKGGRGDGQGLEYGLIAEEVSKIFPELVVTDREGAAFAVQYHKLTPMLLNELQRQQVKLSYQAQELQSLRDRITSLEALFGVSGQNP